MIGDRKDAKNHPVSERRSPTKIPKPKLSAARATQGLSGGARSNESEAGTSGDRCVATANVMS